MNIVEFPEQTIVIAKDQPDYMPMPAHRLPNDSFGKVTCCWKLTWRERFKVLLGGKLWHQILTFHQPLQPQLLLVDKPDLAQKSHGVGLPQSGYVPAKTVRCRRCGNVFDEMDKWVLFSSEQKVVAQPFCSQKCADSFSMDCIGDLTAKPLVR